MTVVVAPVKPTLSQVHSVKTGICQNDKRRERQLKEKIKIETQFIRKLMSIKQQINDFKQGFKKGEISKTFFFVFVPVFAVERYCSMVPLGACRPFPRKRSSAQRQTDGAQVYSLKLPLSLQSHLRGE